MKLIILLLTMVLSEAFEYHTFPPLLFRNAEETKRVKFEDQSYWKLLGQSELEIALSLERNTDVARNVILFIGDGMSLNTIVAARTMKGQLANHTGEEEYLSFERFPHIALSKTYTVDYQVPDSAGTATAFLTGIKTTSGVVGVDSSVKRGDCTTMNDNNKIESILTWSQRSGKRTGIVTTTSVTHATPASAYAHSPHRHWECDGRIPEDSFKYCPGLKDIARQLIEDEPGRLINVVLGGGKKHFDTVDKNNKKYRRGCTRKDGRNLTKDWLHEKRAKGQSAAFVETASELNSVDLRNTDYIMGLFAEKHLPYEYERQTQQLDVPSLAEMTTAAIKVLERKSSEGYFLLVEGGRIDHSHHGGSARGALEETLALDEAVSAALRIADIEETLVIVTADHAHTLSINGYPKRGNDILGVGGVADDSKGYTTLLYTNGPGFDYTIQNNEISRPDPRLQDTNQYSYKQHASIPKRSETHGGDDVGIYAVGPMSHLFHSVHEQSYIAHVMAYASCVGSNLNHCDR